jgi:hypothetical protein
MVTAEPVFGLGIRGELPNARQRPTDHREGAPLVVRRRADVPDEGRSLPSSAIACAGILRGSDASHIAFRLGEYTFEHTPFAGCVVDQANEPRDGAITSLGSPEKVVTAPCRLFQAA